MLMLKELRKVQGLSIAALSTLSGVPRRTIEDIEARGDCRISTAYRLCQSLNVPLDAFYKEEAGE